MTFCLHAPFTNLIYIHSFIQYRVGTNIQCIVHARMHHHNTTLQMSSVFKKILPRRKIIFSYFHGKDNLKNAFYFGKTS